MPCGLASPWYPRVPVGAEYDALYPPGNSTVNLLPVPLPSPLLPLPLTPTSSILTLSSPPPPLRSTLMLLLLPRLLARTVVAPYVAPKVDIALCERGGARRNFRPPPPLLVMHVGFPLAPPPDLIEGEGEAKGYEEDDEDEEVDEDDEEHGEYGGRFEDGGDGLYRPSSSLDIRLP